MRSSTPVQRPRSRGRRALLHLLLVCALSLGIVPLSMTPAHAETRGTLSVTKGVTGWQDGHVVQPGETFEYTILVTCTNTGSGGCTSAELQDSLPAGLLLDGDAGDIEIQPAGAGTATVDGNDVAVEFTQPLTDPPNGQGILPAAVITITIPVRVDPDISADLDGTDITNTATADGTNTDPASDDFTVVPDIPTQLEATTDKSFDPDSAIANPGAETTLTLTGGSASNRPVDEIVLTDPSGTPPGAFTYLGLTGDLDVTLPEGAEQVQIDCYVNGDWVNGDPGAPPAALPTGVDAADCEGVRVHFISTDDEGIPPGSNGTIEIGLEQRANIADAGEGPISNEVSTTVGYGDDTSDPATAEDDYTITAADLPLTASKSFDPDTIAVGSTSTVTLGATNTSTRTLNSLSITEPGGDPNMFENGLSFSGWADGVQWPRGATGATVTYTLANGEEVELTSTDPNTLPDPPAGAEVVGFTVEFTGPIVAGAEASIPFTVTAAAQQDADEVEHPNTITANSTAPGGFEGSATAEDTLTTIRERLAVEVGKRVSPGEILSIPGETATVQLTGTLQDFPASTTDADQIIVQDPADLADSAWWDAFAPSSVVATPIPAGATLTVQYWDGNAWVDVPGMVDLAGPQIFSGDFPADVIDNAQGIRFVYDSEEGFPPGTQVAPNLNFALRPEMADSDLDDIQNCAASDASAGDIDADTATQTPPCPVIDLTPPTPGEGDLVEKEWDDPKVVGERTGAQLGATVSWSTGGRSGLDQVIVADTNNPTAANLPDSVFDTFDLVRVDPITATQDPLLTYDRVARVELYRLGANAWSTAPNDPCPAACDGTFPGYTVPVALRSDVIGVRLVFEESPTRAERIGTDPNAPRVGSGVARSFSATRPIHPVFQLRDRLRSDAGVPVISDAEYNVDGRDGEVRNTVRADGLTDGEVVSSDTDADIVTITDVPVTVTLDKTWSGGPLGIPPEGSAEFPADYPTGRMHLDAHNTTPRRIDRLTISEPAGGTDPFDTFNLQRFVTITDPATIGATGVVITLNPAGPNTRTLTRAEALAAAEADLSDVVGFTIVYTGRIAADAHAVATVDTRLRPTHRGDGSAMVPGATVDNEASTLAEDLVGYPGVNPVVSEDDDTADIELTAEGIGLDVTKTFSPDAQTEPDRSPVTVTLTGRPTGPSRTNLMEIVDEDYTFFNQYDFVGFGTFSFTAPINRVQVDAYVGGTFVVDGDTVRREGGAWVNGTPGTTLTLPAGVTADQVIGLRFTFTRADGSLWENPSSPLQRIPLQVQRRTELRSGGAVLNDLPQNAPAPGETNPGEASDTIQGRNQGADLVGGVPISATDEATDTIVYRHSRNAVTVAKSPNGAQSPGVNIPYRLTFTNTGDTPIIDPVITDQIPSDADGPLLVYDPRRPGAGTGYTFALTGAAPTPPNGTALPTEPTAVTITESPTGIRFRFAPGTVLEVGQRYTITLPLQFRSGLASNTDVTNTTGITGDRPWDACEERLDEETGECQASSTVRPVRAGALLGEKLVRAADPELGVLNTRNLPDPGCVADADGFYVGGCVPVTKPGGDELWRLRFTNTGNLPQDRVYAIDRLPIPGDTAALTTDPRGSEWRPVPKSITYAGVSGGQVSAVRLYYDTDQDICTDDLNLGEQCDEDDWTLLGGAPNPQVGARLPIPANATAIKIEADFFDRMLEPNGQVWVDLTTTTPAQSATDGADTIAWNTVAAAARTDDGGTKGLSPKTEGNKVGVALATGPLEVRKVIDGPAAEYAPDSFDLTVQCTSAGEDVDLGDRANITVTAGETTRLEDIPWGSRCTVSEDTGAAGSPEFTATTVTIARDDETVPIVIATNTYPDASLVLRKAIDGPAEDAEGNPITYGPFRFTVECTYLDQPVYADGYSADTPMTAEFDSNGSATFTELPAGAECYAEETDTDGASSTTSEQTAPDSDDSVTGDTRIGPLTLTKDGEEAAPSNEVTFTNTFRTGSVVITKELSGPGAEAYEVGPFTVHLTCVDAEDPTRTVYDADHELTTDDLTWTVDDLYVDSTCEVTEPGTGGATTSVVSPNGPFAVTADSAEAPVQVTVTNTFALGGLRLIKKIDDPDDRAGDAGFSFEVACQLLVNGEVQDVELPDGGVVELSASTGLVAELDDLPTGAVCTVTETANGGADSSVVQPGAVTIGNATTVDVIATNTFDPLPPPPDEGGSSSSGGGSDLADTGGPSLIFGGIGVLLLIAGGTLLVARRRRG